MSPGELFLLEAFQPENRADPYPLYDRSLASDPVLAAGDNFWIVLDHATTHGLLRTRTASSDERHGTQYQLAVAADPALADHPDRERSMLFLDPPDHTRLRQLVSSAFTPRTIEALVPAITSARDDLLADMRERLGDGETVDLVESLAYPLPVAVICDLLGVPRSDEAAFGRWSRALTKGLDPAVLQTEADVAMFENAETELTSYVSDLIASRAAAPGEDLLSSLIAVRDGEDRLRHDELVNLVQLLLVAGHETTVNLIGNGALALLRHPDQLARLRTEPAMSRNAVDELLRFDSPVQLAMRVLLEDRELHGHQLEAGDQILVILGAANRDPAVFEAPHELDLARPNASRHLSFGGGIHHCLGMALARIEGQLAIDGLLGAFDDLVLTDEPEIDARFTLRGYQAIHVSGTAKQP